MARSAAFFHEHPEVAACNLIPPNEEGNHRSARACENGPDKLHVSMIETVVPVGDPPQAP